MNIHIYVGMHFCYCLANSGNVLKANVATSNIIVEEKKAKKKGCFFAKVEMEVAFGACPITLLAMGV